MATEKNLQKKPRRQSSPGLPLYLQVANTLRDEIVGGVYPIGSLLPTEDALCERFSVSRYTVREALRLLREDSLVSSRRGAGTTVIPPSVSSSDIHQVMSINDLVALTDDTRLAIDAVSMTAIDKKLSEKTGLERDEEWIRAFGYRYSEAATVPVSWADYYIHRDYAAVGRLIQRHNGPVFLLIEDLFGVSISEVQQHISATVLSDELASTFEEAQASAALEVRRVYKTTDGKVVQVTVNIHPASRFQHSMTMRRIKS